MEMVVSKAQVIEDEAIEPEKPCSRSSEDLSEIQARQAKMMRKT